MSDTTGKFEMIAKTFAGLEPVLAKELELINAEKITIGRRMVSFFGNEECMYKANIYLRTALRILKPIYQAKINTPEEYYTFFREIEWEKHMGFHHTFAIDSVINSKLFNNSLYAAQRAKDGIVDRFRDKYNQRPSVDIKHPMVLINVHLSDDRINVSLDSSGEPLSKRGYRTADGGAPLNEVLAAAMILYSNWDPTTPFVDPMTGSGTLAIEAAMIAREMPPGLLRMNYAFQNWPDYNKVLYKKIIDNIELKEFRPKIYANDISQEYIEIARQNAQRALVSSFIHFSEQPISEYRPKAKEGTIIINPPYGERMKPSEIGELYSEIGTALKMNYSGFKAWLITSNKDAFKKIGLRHSSKMQLFNGGLPCIYVSYDIFDGALKDFKKDTSN
jgi:putative N6-adenine-specific DNA methylase